MRACLAAFLFAAPGCAEKFDPYVIAVIPTGGGGATVVESTETDRTRFSGVDARGEAGWTRDFAPRGGAFAGPIAGLVVLVRRTRDDEHVSFVAHSIRNGRERWRRRVRGRLAHHLFEHGDLVLAHVSEELGSDRVSLLGLDARDGRVRFRVADVDSLAEPFAVGDFVLAPVRHADRPALRVIDVRTGGIREVPAGLRFPGRASGSAYRAVHAPGPSSDFISLADMANLAAGRPPTGAMGGAIGEWSWVELDPATGGTRRLRPLPPDCQDPHLVGWIGDRLLCAADETKIVRLSADGETLALDAPAGFGLFGEAVDLGLSRDASSWRDATRYVPLFASDRGWLVEVDRAYHLRMCVLDLETMRTTFCARDVAMRGDEFRAPQSARRGPWHLLSFVAAEGRILTALDGRTGKFGSAVRLHFPGRAMPYVLDVRETVLREDTLYAQAGPHALAIHVPDMRVRWRTGPRRATIEPALADLEGLLGPLPR